MYYLEMDRLAVSVAFFAKLFVLFAMLVLTSKDRALPPLADALLFLVIFIHQVFSIFGNCIFSKVRNYWTTNMIMARKINPKCIFSAKKNGL